MNLDEQKKDEINETENKEEKPKQEESSKQEKKKESPKEKKGDANQPKRTAPLKPAECAGCSKALLKKLWYYRDDAFYCNKKCYKRKIEADRKKEK
ncbi:MAG: hypothetical protein ABH844_07310 [Candidatus Omnitrophota bacterium]